MTVLVVIQARMGSSRLPGKVLMDLGGRPALGLQLERLRPLRCDGVVIATTTETRDDVIVELAQQHGVDWIRGSEADVLARFGLAVDRFDPSVVVRLTGDCPLTDPALVAEVVQTHIETGADYTSNVFPRTFPKGLDVEVADRAAFDLAVAEATEPSEREHVMPFLHRRPERFSIANVECDERAGDLRWTLDTSDDLARLRRIVQSVPDPVGATWREILTAVGRDL